MSHGLRMPLNAVLGYTELILGQHLRRGAGEGPRGHCADRQNGRHLLGLINDVLDLSKIEAGQLTLSIADYSIQALVQTGVVAVEALAAEKKLALRVDVARASRAAAVTNGGSARCS